MKTAATILFVTVCFLLSLGIVTLVSASTGSPEARYLVMQPIWCGLGLVACGITASGDYRWLKRQSWLPWVLFGAILLLLGAVLIPGIGIKTNGARRWLGYNTLRMQPSELAKIVLIVILAFYADRFQKRMGTFWRGMVIPWLLAGTIIGLIFKEPDVGTAMLLTVVSASILLVAGMNWKLFLPPVVLGIVAIGVFLARDPMRSDRIYSWLHLEETKLGKGMQTYQAMVALGAGGVTGKGLGDGRQKLGFVPEHPTDFILSVVGEELGFVATMAVLMAFLTIFLCGIWIATRAADPFGMFIATGITFLIGLQAIINIGVVTGALPNKGLALPFMSYGGSNLVVMLAAVGTLINIARHAPVRESLPSKDPWAGHDLAPLNRF